MPDKLFITFTIKMRNAIYNFYYLAQTLEYHNFWPKLYWIWL